jgi:hypothetical protein
MSTMSGGRIRLWYDGRGDFLEVMFEADVRKKYGGKDEEEDPDRGR